MNKPSFVAVPFLTNRTRGAAQEKRLKKLYSANFSLFGSKLKLPVVRNSVATHFSLSKFQTSQDAFVYFFSGNFC